MEFMIRSMYIICIKYIPDASSLNAMRYVLVEGGRVSGQAN